MPLVGTHTAAADAVVEAQAAVKAMTNPEKVTAKAMRAVEYQALFAHIVANTLVTVTSVSGVTTGPGVSGPGAGTVG